MKKISQAIQKPESKTSKILALGDFLTESRYRNEFCMNITMTQGLLYAVASSPCLSMPSDWTALIFGGIPEFQSIEQQKDIYEAALALYAHIGSELALGHKKTDLSLWIEYGREVDLQTASNRQLIDFCSGYVKGYLLDPILRKTFADIPDLSFAFFISIIKLGTAKGKLSDIDEVMRKTLQHIMVENYLNWLGVRKLNLGKPLS
ncbi:hypothetical protein GAMM_110029 [Gammaproteobacteria bacterium]